MISMSVDHHVSPPHSALNWCLRHIPLLLHSSGAAAVLTTPRNPPTSSPDLCSPIHRWLVTLSTNLLTPPSSHVKLLGFSQKNKRLIFSVRKSWRLPVKPGSFILIKIKTYFFMWDKQIRLSRDKVRRFSKTWNTQKLDFLCPTFLQKTHRTLLTYKER